MSDLESIIKDSVQNGKTIQWDYNTIANGQDIDGAIYPVEVEIGIQLDSISSLTGILGGKNIQSALPSGKLPLGDLITLEAVVFDLFTNSQTIGGIRVYLSFGKDKSGLTFPIATVGSSSFSITLLSLGFSWIEPASLSSSIFSVSADGLVKIGDLNLEVNASYPSGDIQIFQPPTLSLDLGTFFQNFGLAIIGKLMSNLMLVEFNLYISGSDKSFYLSAEIEVLQTDTSKPYENTLTLIPAISSGSPTILGISDLSVEFFASSGMVNATLTGKLVCLEKLALTTIVTIDTSTGTWSFDGYLDLIQTWLYLNPDAKQPDTYQISLGDLANIFGNNASNYIPAAIKNIYIEAMSVDYTYSNTESSNYSFNGIFKEEWNLSGTDISAEVNITLGNQEKKIAAEFEIDGFKFTLGCDITSTTEQISASIEGQINGQSLSASGTFIENNSVNPPNKTATLTVTSLPSLGALMAWFIERITGNPFFTLPEPWNGLLNDISFNSILKDLSFSIEIIPPNGSVTITQKIFYCTLIPPTEHNTIFGVTITGITLSYDSSKKAEGNSGLSFQISCSGNIPFLNKDSISWDPINEQPPLVPGQSPVMDLQLLVLGQHVDFNPKPSVYPAGYTIPPTTVEEAVADLEFALTSLDSSSPPAMVFNKTAGWLVGAHAKFLGQVDVQLVFDDPKLYGLMVKVNSGKNQTLNKLAGLYAEIIYRKISETVGEYQGILVLPDSIRKMQFGNAYLTLPSISVSIYTNGDFAFDIGFPYNLDFSNSFSVTADGFTGAGGFYYAKLDGLNPSSVPEITNGVFNPITEIGVGFRVGREVGFNKGPLSASASIVLEASFQGVFAKFTSNDGTVEDEYYSIDATIAIVGHIKGEIDFAIITASLDAIAYIQINATLVAYQSCKVTVTVGVSVRLTVTINLGLFKIHIHCSFSTTYRTEVEMGSSSTPPWILKQAQPPRSLSERESFLLVGDILDPSPIITWQEVSISTPLLVNIDIIPQPTTIGNNNWYYVCQFAINFDESANPSYMNFIKAILVWTLYGLTNSASSSTYESILGTSTSSTNVTLTQIKNFTKALSNQTSFASVAPSITDVQKLFKLSTGTALLSANISTAENPTSTSNYKAVFFPALPGTNVTVTLSDNQDQNKPDPEPGLPDTDTIKNQQDLLIEFIMLTVSNLLDHVENSDAFDTSGNSTVYTILNKIDSDFIDSIAGLTTRFMLHGTRLGDASLYSKTGQQKAFSPQVSNKSLSMNINNPSVLDWGANFNPIFICSNGTTQTLINQPSDFMGANAPTLDPQEFTGFGFSELTKPAVPKEYQLKIGVNLSIISPGLSLWNLPKSLLTDLSLGIIDPSNCSLMQVSIDTSTGAIMPPSSSPLNPSPAPLNSFVTKVEFKIKKIPLPVSKGQKASYVKNIYQLASVNQIGLMRLEDLIKDIQYATNAAGQSTIKTCPVVNTQLAYTVDQNLSINLLGNNIFMLQSNYSGVMPNSPPNPNSPDFIYKLWISGTSNKSGCYLYWGDPSPLPDKLFDEHGVAEISLIVTLTSLTSYTTGVLVNGIVSTYTGKENTMNLYIADSADLVVKASYSPEKIPVRVTRNVPSAQSLVLFSNLVNGLYNVLDISCSIGGLNTTNTISPKNADITSPDGKEIWYYDSLFSSSLAFVSDKTGNLPPAKIYSPYFNIYNGINPSFIFNPIDFFGNEWGQAIQPITSSPITLTYTDPLFSLKHLPFLHTNYSFDSDGNINLNFVFSFKGYGTATGQVNRDHQAADVWALAQAIYQLDDPNIIATLNTSFATEVDNSQIISGMMNNLLIMYKALDTNIVLNTQLNPIIIAITKSTINTFKFFPLSVTLIIQRTKFVNPAFGTNSSVAQSSMMVSPEMLVNKGTDTKPDYMNDLSDFAKSFEAAYLINNMKIAVGAIDKHGSRMNAHQVWVVRYGNLSNINISFAQVSANPVYYSYSPKPLSNKLLSRANIPVNKFIGGKITPSTITVTNIDLDQEMSNFLKALDIMFTPEMMVSATRINSDSMSKLNTYKETIIGNLLNYITYSPKTGSGVDAALLAAQELYRNECKLLMSNFYKMDAVAVFEVSSNPGFNDLMNFLGTAIPNNTTKTNTAEVSLTTGTASVPTTNSTYMPIGIFPKNASKSATYDAHLDFKLTAIEHDLENISIIENTSLLNYPSGFWFKFVIKPEPLAIGNISVPLPLRVFPTPPNLGKLDADDLANEITAATDQNIELMYIKSWSLNGAYSYDYVAQDTLSVTVEMNQDITNNGSSFRSELRTDEIDLLDALIQFRTMYPTIKPYLDQIMSAQNPAEASDVIAEFVNLTEQIANCNWTLNNQVRNYLLNQEMSGLIPLVARFDIQESISTDNKNWNVTVKCIDPVNALGFCPQIYISGYKASLTESSSNMSATFTYTAINENVQSPEQIKDRLILVAPWSSLIPANWPIAPNSINMPLDILTSQEGNLSFKIKRNLEMAVVFQYETANVTYKKAIFPQLVTDESVKLDIGKLTIGQKPITDHLTNFLRELKLDYQTGQNITNGQLQTSVTFNYPIGHLIENLQKFVSIPIMIRIPTDFSDDNFIASIVNSIRSWVNKNYINLQTLQANSNLKDSFFNFDISLYSGAIRSGNPILRIRNTELKITDITEL